MVLGGREPGRHGLEEFSPCCVEGRTRSAGERVVVERAVQTSTFIGDCSCGRGTGWVDQLVGRFLGEWRRGTEGEFWTDAILCGRVMLGFEP